jgi:hypothetical protein
MPKTLDIASGQRWVQLAGASIYARDDLRRLAEDLSAAMAAGSISRVLIIRARDTAVRHADGLRQALKHPSQRTPRRPFNRDMPCWSEIGQDQGANR